MKALKILSNLVVLGFIVFTVLLLSNVLDTKAMFNVSTEEQTLMMYKVLAAVGAGVMLLKLLITYLYIAGIRHEQHLAQLKINSLKADLYEKRQAFRSNSHRQEEEETEEAPMMKLSYS